MGKIKDPILLDNCAISACLEVGGWIALVGGYRLETVREVESEASTGFQHRHTIDPREFRKQVAVHDVPLVERLKLESQFAELGKLDPGERDLWVHALGRGDSWVLCGPDIASIYFGVRAGNRDRLVSLEELLDAIGFKPKIKLKEHQTKKWLQKKINDAGIEIAFDKK